MTGAEWFVVQLLTAICAGIFAIIGAWLLFFETVADSAATNKLKQRIGAALQTISASPLADLPGYLLSLSAVLQRGRDRIINWVVVDKVGSRIAGTFAALMAVGVVAIRYGLMPLYVFGIVHFASERRHYERRGGSPRKAQAAFMRFHIQPRIYAANVDRYNNCRNGGHRHRVG